MCDPEDMGEAGKRAALVHLYPSYGVSHRWSGNLRPVFNTAQVGHDLSSSRLFIILTCPTAEVGAMVLTLRLSSYWVPWYFIVGSHGQTKPLSQMAKK